MRSLIKEKSDGLDKGDELPKALSRISQLNKEKIVLTELSNRLRAELSKAGIDMRKPATSVARPGSNVPPGSTVNRTIPRKLDELENRQYELMRANITKSSKESARTSGPRDSQSKTDNSPPTKQGKASVTRKGGQYHQIPRFVEQTSSSGSSFKAKGEPIHLQHSRIKAKDAYKAPPLKNKPKSNVAWVKDKLPKVKDQTVLKSDDVEDDSTEAAVADPNSVLQSTEQRDRSQILTGVLDSMDLGSSIQEVWKLLDDQPSLNSTTPD